MTDQKQGKILIVDDNEDLLKAAKMYLKRYFTQVDIEKIPMIDFAPFLSGDEAARQAVADEIAEACRVIGFFYLKGHGVSQGLLAECFEVRAHGATVSTT